MKGKTKVSVFLNSPLNAPVERVALDAYGIEVTQPALRMDVVKTLTATLAKNKKTPAPVTHRRSKSL